MRSLVCLLSVCACIPIAIGVGPTEMSPAEPTKAASSSASVEQAKPFLQKYCVGCHNDKKDSGGLNLAHVDAQAVANDRETWETVRRRVTMKEMPTKNKPKPEEAERAGFVAWIDGQLKNTKSAP